MINQRTTFFDSPALKHKSEHWPIAAYGARIPRRVRMTRTVRSDIPDGLTPPARQGESYEVWVNSHGAVAAFVSPGVLLGLKMEEFEVAEWWDGSPAQNPPLNA